MTDELKRTWFRVSRANSAEQAHQLLETRDNIVHVIVNLSASMSDDQIVEYIREARKELAWSRLPALLLLPPSRDELEQKLIDDGATSPCLMKPVTIEEVIAYSNKAATKVLSN